MAADFLKYPHFELFSALTRGGGVIKFKKNFKDLELILASETEQKIGG